MNIDPKSLPEGTVVGYKWRDGIRDERVAYVEKCIAAGCFDNPSADVADVTRVFVPVPDGMTVEDATQALADHVQWVPLPDGPTEAHVGARLRCEDPEYRFAFEIVPDQVIPNDGRNDGTVWGGGGMAYSIPAKAKERRWFIHPDDVPADPDGELIEAMASVLWGKRWDEVSGVPRANYLDKARAALAVVREHEAGTR